MRAGPNPMTREIVGSAPCYHGDGGSGAVGGSAQGWEAGNGAAVCVCSRRWGLVAGACGPDHCGDWWHRPRELAYLLRSLIKLSPPLPPGGGPPEGLLTPKRPKTADFQHFLARIVRQCAHFVRAGRYFWKIARFDPFLALVPRLLGFWV